MCCPLSLNTVHALWSILNERIPFGSGCCCWLVLSQLFLMCSGCWEVIFSLLECGIFQGTQMSPAPSCHPRLCVVWAGWVPSLMKCVWLKCWGPFNKHNALTLSHWKVLAGRCSSGTKLFIGSSASRLLLSAGWTQDVGALLVLTEGENSSVPVSHFVQHLLIREKQQCQARALVFWCSMVVLFCWWSSCVCFFSKLFLILWLQMEKPRKCLKKWKKKKKKYFQVFSIAVCYGWWLHERYVGMRSAVGAPERTACMPDVVHLPLTLNERQGAIAPVNIPCKTQCSPLIVFTLTSVQIAATDIFRPGNILYGQYYELHDLAVPWANKTGSTMTRQTTISL